MRRRPRPSRACARGDARRPSHEQERRLHRDGGEGRRAQGSRSRSCDERSSDRRSHQGVERCVRRVQRAGPADVRRQQPDRRRLRLVGVLAVRAARAGDPRCDLRRRRLREFHEPEQGTRRCGLRRGAPHRTPGCAKPFGGIMGTISIARIVTAIVVVFILSCLFGTLIHGMLLQADYATVASLYRSAPDTKFIIIFVGYLGFAIGSVWMYAHGVEDRPWFGQGVRFGIAVWLVLAVPSFLIAYAVQPLPEALVWKQLAYEFV